MSVPGGCQLCDGVSKSPAFTQLSYSSQIAMFTCEIHTWAETSQIETGVKPLTHVGMSRWPRTCKIDMSVRRDLGGGDDRRDGCKMAHKKTNGGSAAALS